MHCEGSVDLCMKVSAYHIISYICEVVCVTSLLHTILIWSTASLFDPSKRPGIRSQSEHLHAGSHVALVSLSHTTMPSCLCM